MSGRFLRIAAALLLSFVWPLPSLGAEDVLKPIDKWSFADHPHPKYHELSQRERDRIEQSRENNVQDDACTAWIKAEFGVYERRYPEFRQWGDEESRYRNWKIHMSHSRHLRGVFSSCLSAPPFMAISDYEFRVSPDFYFCGHYSRPPANETERELAALIDELFVYAQSASESSVNMLLSKHENGPFIRLNPDVAYYFYNLTTPIFLEEVGPRDTSHLDPLLGDADKAFLEQAAEDRNLAAVLERTPPCPQLEKAD